MYRIEGYKPLYSCVAWKGESNLCSFWHRAPGLWLLEVHPSFSSQASVFWNRDDETSRNFYYYRDESAGFICNADSLFDHEWICCVAREKLSILFTYVLTQQSNPFKLQINLCTTLQIYFILNVYLFKYFFLIAEGKKEHMK